MSLNGYDNWKMASEHEDAPPLDAECDGCGQEDYQGNLVDDLCQDCLDESPESETEAQEID